MNFNPNSIRGLPFELSDKQKNKWVNVANMIYTSCIESGDSEEDSVAQAEKVASAAVKIKSRESGLDLTNAKVFHEKLALEMKTATFEKDMIKNVKIIRVGKASSRKYYSREALATLVPFLKQTRGMFVNHRFEQLGRDLGDLLAILESVWQGSDGDLYGDIRLLNNSKYTHIIEAIKKDPTVCALSIFAFIEAHEGIVDGENLIIVDKFIGAHSVDFVYQAGAGGGFAYESNDVVTTYELDGLSFTSTEFLTAMESIGQVPDINVDRVTESFSRQAHTHAFRELFYWFSEYIMWNCIYACSPDGEVTKEMKLELINSAFAEFKVLLIDFLGKSNYWEQYDDSSKESYVNIEKAIVEGKQFETFVTNIKQAVETRLKELTVKPEDLKGLQERNPDYQAIEALGFTRGTESFLAKETALETKITELSNLSKESEKVVAESAKLQEKLTAVEAELAEFKQKEAEAQKAIETKKRKELIDATMTEAKVSVESIPDVIMKKMESIESFADDEVYSTIKSFAVESKTETTTTKTEEKKAVDRKSLIDGLKNK